MRILFYVMSFFIISLLIMNFENPKAEAAKFIPADSPEIQYFGRWDNTDGIYRCGFGATYIKANFNGTFLMADLEGEGIWWRVSIDGGKFKKFNPTGKNIVLAQNLKPGQHSVLLVRSTEGQAGISTFRGFILDDHDHLMTPDPLKKIRLEFVGDSITAGAINDGKWINDNYNDVEDGDMAFGPQLARMLNADYSVVAKSGQGVVHNYAETRPYNGVHAGDSYMWTFFSNEFGSQNLSWDTARFPVDAIIISLGTNDFSDASNRPTAEEFMDGYAKLLSIVRAQNPGKAIICTEPLPYHLGMEVRSLVEQVVAKAQRNGDHNIYFVALNDNKPLLKASDYVDGKTHPTKKGSTKIANFLKDKVTKILSNNK